MTASDYKQLMHDNLTQDYKLDNSNKLAEINEDTKKHARSLQIIDRIERHSESNAFLTIKDHKPEFPNTIKYRIINPASNKLGKVSKWVFDKINTKCRTASSVNQWRSTQDVLNWFSLVHSNNCMKKKSQFLQFDICEFYPSISEELLDKALVFAKLHTTVTPDEEDMIKSCRKSVLFNDGKVWTKKDKDFDVTMGAQDGNRRKWLNWLGFFYSSKSIAF